MGGEGPGLAAARAVAKGAGSGEGWGAGREAAERARTQTGAGSEVQKKHWATKRGWRPSSRCYIYPLPKGWRAWGQFWTGGRFSRRRSYPLGPSSTTAPARTSGQAPGLPGRSSRSCKEGGRGSRSPSVIQRACWHYRDCLRNISAPHLQTEPEKPLPHSGSESVASARAT